MPSKPGTQIPVFLMPWQCDLNQYPTMLLREMPLREKPLPVLWKRCSVVEFATM